jgi:REP element-mobilizing transposase RayT
MDNSQDASQYRTWRRNRALRYKGHDYADPYPCFVTFCTADKQSLLRDKLADALQSHMISIGQKWQFRLWAWCIMPDHVHVIAVPQGNGRSLSDFVGAVKSLATKTAREMEQRDKLWQSGFYDRILRPSERPEELAAYIVANPVRRGLIREGEKWPWAYLDPEAI